MSSEVSAVYSEALFSLANEQGDTVLQETRSDLRQCAMLFSLNPDLERLLSLPTISVEERLQITEKIFGSDGLASRLLFLLVDHERVSYLGEIADDFDRKMLEYQNTADVTVTTAVSINPEQKEKLRKALEKKLNRTVRINERIDRSILGGVIVQYGDTRIDNSVRNRLDTLKERLS
ncbi:MAG: ATP synthase F1 subunit delta [Oscillospiraceae bacterium]|nr:ATP synthase F1 subunit delta [Oscillospiraceae bacterium]